MSDLPHDAPALAGPPTIRCTNCRHEFNIAQVERHHARTGRPGCPHCGTLGVPMSIDEDVTVRINWHELRILGIFATNWAERAAASEGPGHDARGAVRSILRELERQRPEGAAPLTIAAEIQEIADALGTTATVTRDGDTTTITPREKN